MTTMASQITSLTVVYSIVNTDADQRKHQSSASLAFVWGIHRGPVNSPHKGPVMRKMFPFDDVIMRQIAKQKDWVQFPPIQYIPRNMHTVLLCFALLWFHIHQGCFAGTGAIVRLPQCQWSKPDGYGKISQCLTTTKHSKAKTVCIFLGIYCTSMPVTELTANSE